MGKQNYVEERTGSQSINCYIFVSGNGLYYPNTNENFLKTVVEGNRYEWQGIAGGKDIQCIASKIIFIRDVYKQWYVKGINSEFDTIDAVVKLLKNLTNGYEVSVIGNSAGGCMATILAIKLNAKRCFSFSGQFSIMDQVSDGLLLHAYEKDEERNKYFDLTDDINEASVPIYYFYPARCEWDREQYQSIKQSDAIRSFGFNASKHVSTMLSTNISRVLCMENEELDELYDKYINKEINRFDFAVKSMNLFCGMKIINNQIYKTLNRRINNSKQKEGKNI